MGKIFIGNLWKKPRRPMIEIEYEGVVYHAGISHTEDKKGMIRLTQDDLEEGSIFEVDEDSYAGLSNKSKLQEDLGKLGSTKEEFDKRLLEANAKLQKKVAKRNK